MSIMAACTCRKQFGCVFGDYETTCPRHGSTAKWLKERAEQRAIKLLAIREKGFSRPTHGGYPDAVKETP